MKPEIALKMDYDRFKECTREQIETIRDEWIAAYREIAESDSSKKELCDSLTDRISRAAELFIRRHIEPAKSDAISHDDYYYEWLDEMKKSGASKGLAHPCYYRFQVGKVPHRRTKIA